MKSSLRLAEWLLSFSVLLVLLCLFVIAKISSCRSRGDSLPPIQTAEISILGHVGKPGVYSVDIGTPLLEAFVKARPKSFADLSIYVGRNVERSEVFAISRLDVLSVHVNGACLPGTFQVPAGARLSDLKGMLTLSSDADLSFFKKRRLLKDQENIKIPLKK